MKKLFTFLLCSFMALNVAFGQTVTQTNTQFPNPGFESWKQHSSASTSGGTNAKYVPYNWHTFDEATVSIFSFCSFTKVVRYLSPDKNATGTFKYEANKELM